MEEAVSDEESNQKIEDSQGSFLFGSGFALLSGLVVMGIGFTVPLDQFGFWNVVIIALSLPVVAGSLVIKWKGSGKKAMAKGAMTILVIGGIVMIGVTIWFISILNSLGN
ncbi:MAG: hypothetical protein DWC07_06075 [Candidatus Poseidoniales archaeon]|nr:MAG: hypothetical protein DWC07_06075 [Candidatus Poseidoniales archaeon]